MSRFNEYLEATKGVGNLIHQNLVGGEDTIYDMVQDASNPNTGLIKPKDGQNLIKDISDVLFDYFGQDVKGIVAKSISDFITKFNTINPKLVKLQDEVDDSKEIRQLQKEIEKELNNAMAKIVGKIKRRII